MKLAVRFIALVMVGILAFLLLLTKKEEPAEAAENPCITSTGPMASGPVRVPVTGSYTATSPFGMRVNPGGILKGRYMPHAGIDLVSTSKEIVSATGGTVKATPINSISGYQVIIDAGGGVMMDYNHLVPGSVLVKPGEKVWPGRKLATEGATGNVTGVHLHFAVRLNGKYVDPAPWMASKGAKFPPIGGRSTAPGAVVKAPTSTPSSESSSSASPVAMTSSTGTETDMAFPLPPAVDADRKDSKHNPPLSIPVDVMNAYKAAAKRYGIPWTLLAGIGMEETGHGRNKNVSSAGAQGPMQFIPGTWATMGVDGDGDGTKDVRDVDDAVHAAANYLVQSGVKKGPEGVRKAIWAYNHASWYVNDVLYYAGKYGGGQVGNGGGNGCDTGSSAPRGNGKMPAVPAVGKGSPAQIVQAAKAWTGTPYSWGGGGFDGPSTGIRTSSQLDGTRTVGFDCSGFVQMAVWHGMGIKMPDGSNQQIDWTGNKDVTVTHVDPDPATLQPGDLIGVSRAGGAPGTFNHIGIYIGNNQWIDAPKPGTTIQVRTLKGYGGTWKVLRLSY